MDAKIKKFAEMQKQTPTALCPRCGQMTMSLDHPNALSRRADIEICSGCGTVEALADWMGEPDPIEEWAIMKMEGVADNGIPET